MTWRRLVLQHGREFLEWLDKTNAQVSALTTLTNHLEKFLIACLPTSKDCLDFWNAIPLVRSACNSDDTYKQPQAVVAYAYVHMLDRYWRTWDVLIELTRKGSLPVGAEGVNVLDVGTGPAPTPYAIQDFYSLLRAYGQKNDIDEFTKQDTHFAIVEKSPEMRRFMHWFSEHCLRLGPFGAVEFDFSEVNPPASRSGLQRHLRDKEYYDASVDEYYYEYLPSEANTIAQRHQRYRILVFSNFFTVGDDVRKYKQTLETLFSDLRSGSAVIVLGARGKQYKDIYSQLTEIAEQSGLVRLMELQEELDSSSQLAQEQIKKFQHTIFCHLEQMVGSANIPQEVRLKNYHYRDFVEQSPEINFPERNTWPDYWCPFPSPKKRTGFALRVFRKGKWPQ